MTTIHRIIFEYLPAQFQKMLSLESMPMLIENVLNIDSFHDLNQKYGCKSKIYVGTNELSTQAVRDELEKTKFLVNGAYFGVSGLYNLRLIYHCKAQFAVLADINENQVQFNRNVIEYLKGSSSKKEFCDKLKDDVLENEEAYIPSKRFKTKKLISLPKSLEMDVDNNPFSNDENFEYLAKMAKEDRIKVLSLSLTDPEAIEQLAKKVHERGLQFSLVYVSNVWGYFSSLPEKTAQNNFKKSLTYLTDESTFIIDSRFMLDGETPKLKQFLHHNQNYNPEKNDGLKAIDKTDHNF